MNIVERNSNNNIFLNSLDYNDLVQKFLSYIDVSKNTLDTYKRCLRQFCVYITQNNIANPTRDDILSWKEYLMQNNKPNTTNLYLVSIKNFYKWLSYEYGIRDITENIKSISIEKKHLKRSISVDELKKVLEQCKDIREELMIKLMCTCGLRENELVNIQLNDFYTDNGIVMLNVLGKGKTSKIDSVKIDNRVFNLIQEYIKEYDIEDYLFTSTSNHNKGGKLTTKTIRVIITNLFDKANIDRDRLSTHSFRHFSATQALKSGMNIVEVSEMLRHSNVSTTQVYIDEINKTESKFSQILSDLVF